MKHAEEILLRINYRANSQVEAEEKIKKFSKSLSDLTSIREVYKLEFYWKEADQYQVLYIFDSSKEEDLFVKIRDGLCQTWDVCKNNEAIWSSISVTKHENFLHPEIKWAHLERIIH